MEISAACEPLGSGRTLILLTLQFSLKSFSLLFIIVSDLTLLISVNSALEVSLNDMLYINSHLTYLLTYLLTAQDIAVQPGKLIGIQTQPKDS